MHTNHSTRIMTLLLTITLLSTASVMAGARIEKELALSPGGHFALDADTGSVRIRGTSGDTARIVITSKRDDFESHFDVEFSESPGKVGVKVDKLGSKVSSWFKRDPGLAFEIEVPQQTSLTIETSGGSISVETIEGATRLDTSGGSIEVSAVRGEVLADASGGSITVTDVQGDVHADTSGGGITVEQVDGEVTADTSGGSIRMTEVSGDVNAETSGGSIRIKEAGGRVTAGTSGGPVEVSFVAGNASGGQLSTSGGGVTVYLDPAVGLDVDAATSGGSVKLDIPLTVQGKISRSAVKGTLGSGGAMLTLRSSGGSIRVASR